MELKELLTQASSNKLVRYGFADYLILIITTTHF